MRPGRASVLLACSALAVPGPFASTSAQAQGPRNVLVVVNANNGDSVRIGEYYVGKRHIPGEQLVRLTGLPADPPDGIDRSVFERGVDCPIADWLVRHQAQDRILFIVLTKGIPVRINGGARGEDAASVDSELATLYLRLTGVAVPLKGPYPNPYFLDDRPVAEGRPFSRHDQQIYLVSRLDGFTVDDVIGLIDRGAAPSQDGRFILDEKSAWTDKGNVWLREAARRLKAEGLSDDRVVLDESTAVVTDQVDVLGYYSWGSNDPAIHRRQFGLTYRPGAIGGMFVSTDGRTFREPPKDWTLPGWDEKQSWFAGTPQSLAGDLIREGITGVSANVAEPLLGNTVRPDILFPAYVKGFSLIEAYYLAMPSVSWMTVVVGDPLCAPFAKPATETTDADVPIDPSTELPQVFSDRRLAAMPGTRAPAQALRLLLRADSRLARGDNAGAREDLERVTDLAPALTGAQLLLASQYEAAGAFDRAIAVYRKLLTATPDSAVALNNLAFALAVHKGQVAEALPLARRARELAPQSGAIADTLGWLEHLSGDDSSAAATLSDAARLAPDVGEIHLHLAQLYAAGGNREGARRELAAALALDPSLEARPEVHSLEAP